MRYFLLPVIFMASVISLQAQKHVFHDRDAVVRDVGDFTAIEVSSVIDLQLSQGDENSLAVSAGGNVNRDLIKTVVENGVLKIYYDQKNWFRGSSRKIRAYVSAKTLRHLSASGASDITINGGFKTGDLDVQLSGGSDFRGSLDAAKLNIGLSGGSRFKGVVKADKLNVSQSGASDVDISGNAGDLGIEASGASHFSGYDLAVENCKVAASGATDISITVNKLLNADASGRTTINYKGSGKVGEIRTSGMSNITKRS